MKPTSLQFASARLPSAGTSWSGRRKGFLIPFILMSKKKYLYEVFRPSTKSPMTNPIFPKTFNHKSANADQVVHYSKEPYTENIDIDPFSLTKRQQTKLQKRFWITKNPSKILEPPFIKFYQNFLHYAWTRIGIHFKWRDERHQQFRLLKPLL